MIKCSICLKELVSIKALSQHIRFHNVSSQQYYDEYISKSIDKQKCVYCGKETKFRYLSLGYQKYCGSICSNNDEERKKKFRDSYLKNDFQKVKEKRGKTNLEKYGNENANASLEIREKTKNIFLEKFGVINPMKLKEFSLKSTKRKLEKCLEKNKDLFFERQIKLSEDQVYKGAHSSYIFICNKCDNEFESIWNYVQQGKLCPACRQNGISQDEKEIKNFLKEWLPHEEILENTRQIIKPKELDIFLPNLNIAIEFNGLYAHSANCPWGPKDRGYHIAKTKDCERNHIRLIHIFEDEWLFKRDIVVNRLKHILNLSDAPKIYARNCIIKEISMEQKNEFLDKYHLQGCDLSNIKLGAFYNNELISVMTFSFERISKGIVAEDQIWELSRFCTNYKYRIIGIASKLLKYFQQNYEWKRIFSYADRRWSNGNLYYKLGFELEKTTKPNYWYFKRLHRFHRFSFRKTKNDNPYKTEFQLRKEEGYDWIWDCGNLKFSMINRRI